MQAHALDYPHFEINNIGCDSCHFIYGTQPSLLPPWTAHTPQNIDDTQYNTLCWSCHNDVDAPYVRTHSSLQIDDSYGDWTVECRVCHNPHYQKQKEYGSSSYLYSDTSTSVTATTITKTDAGWTDSAYEGMVVIPNISQNKYVYKITGNTSDTLTVQGPINLTKVTAGNTFGILYGNLVNKAIDLSNITIDPSKSGSKTTRFFRPTGSKSFADGDSTYDGVCEVCHTQTTHFRNNGGGSNQLHTNVGSPAGTNCTTCHSHTYGFRHGGGEGTGCDDCHGHDAGYGGATGGKGTYVAHSTHTENDSDDLRGPNIGCGTCHNTGSFPNFADGVSYADYKSGTEMTTVCNTCHSPDGTYNGVSDAAVGAKNNWSVSASSDSRIYETNGNLKAGKEKWCATCHDESPSQIQSVNAPNVVGDENGEYTYGTGWGFYKTGHGLSAGSTYPASGGVTAGAGKGCLDCHLSNVTHIDSLARTFDDNNSGADQSSEYRIGFRLKQISGQEPMVIPKNNDGNSSSDYRLCMQAACHPDNGTGPFLDGSNLSTNMVNGSTNLHYYHLDFNNAEYSPDWDGSYISEPTCVTCHNVHGSKRFTMLRDGSLTGATDGFEIWYYNPDIVSSGNPPSPDDLPLSASTGTVYQRDSPRDFCAASCHSVNITTTTRNPYQNVSQAPTLDWTGETNYTTDGVNPDSGNSGSNFTFRVKYTDTNNDAPTYIQVWVDMNDDGDYSDADEQLNMTAANPVDSNYTDGKFYTKTLPLSSAGDNTLNYRFYAHDGTSEASGSPASDLTVSIANSAPALTWTGELYYVSDGVDPNTGGTGASYVFRIKYTDADGTAPSSMQVWVDTNDDGDYLDTNEKQDMTLVGGDSDYSNGELYTKALSLSYAGDGSLNYRFYANDGTVDATGTPTSNSSVTIMSSANNPPYLDWVVETCRSNGVKPALGLATGNSEFKIKYTDPDNECPPAASDIQVWIDINDNGTYESGEKYNLTGEDSGDTTCSDGKNYKVTKQLGYAGDGVFNYRFYASDGTDIATGDPVTTDSTLTVVSTANAKGVRTGSESGPDWYGSIQAAIDATNGAHTVLVYEGTYNVGTYLYFNGADDNNTNVKSVCGADSTILTGSGTVVYFLSNSGSTLDGFSITGGNYGILLNSSSPTITNNKIYGINGSGIDTGNSGSVLTLSNSEIYSNTGRGVYIRGGSGNTITNSIIRDNPGGFGAGVYTLGPVTFTDTTIKNNTATGNGGGVNSNSAALEFYRCTIMGNVASGRSGAIELGNAGATAYLENSIVADNQGEYGGASFVNGGSFTAVNSTFANNRATSSNGGAISNNSGTVTIRNSIFWNNMANTVGHIAYLNGGTMVISDSIMNNDGDEDFSDVPYFYNGSPTISGYTSESDPLFVDESGKDYHITASSNAIDNASATYAPANDIDGDSRPQGSADDIGADEYGGTTNNTPSLSWTGETNYASDGVNPNSSVGGSSFSFRINYADADNDAPTPIQVWVDTNDSGTYEAGEKYNMTEVNNDTVYSDGKLYTKTLTLLYAGNGTFNYRFYASDGTVDASGAPTSDSTVTLTNNVPALSWTGETNYTSDGVNPDSGVTGGSYIFRIDYTDVDNAAPGYIEVWIDEDDSGVYDLDEKYSMTAADDGDTTYSDGKRYTKTLTLTTAGDGVLKYTFRASDGTDSATGSPTSDKTVTVTGAPTLDWTGEANYVGDGVNPDSAVSGSSFEFRVKYTDAGNVAPTSIQVWIDRNDDGDFLDASEKEDMTEVDALDVTYTDGKLYTKSLTLTEAGDGDLNYRFYATNGTDDAVGTPTSNSTVVINNPPTLAWTGESNYTSDGVDPNSAADGSNFTFRIKYTDSDNDAPSSIQVWVDRNDDGDYLDANEKENMTVDGGDGNYTNGEIFTKTLTLSAAGDGNLDYRFYAKDAADDATGTPTSDSTVTVTSSATLLVPSQYATIQAAINAAVAGNIVRVSDGTYSENINFNGKAITVESVNGSGSTTIQGSGSNAAVVTFNNSESSASVLDGFTIDNQASNSLTRGIYISGAAPIIQNSIIQGNAADNSGDLLGGGGVLINDSAPTFDNVTIRANTALNRNGCGMYILGAAGGATITNSTIGGTTSGDANNCSNGAGGGIYYTGSTTGTLSISGSNIQYNQSANDGGGLYLSSITNTTTISNTTILNNSTSNGNGGGVYSSGAPLSITGGAISSNTVPSIRGGGGLYAVSTSATINGTTINSNASGSVGGGGVYFSGTTLNMTKSYVQGNSASGNGGGINIAVGTATITNCLITGNSISADFKYGGGISNSGTLYLYSSTISGNYVERDGGGVNAAGTETVQNSIIWGNLANLGSNKSIYGTAESVTYSDIEGGHAGTGNINSDPQFVNAQQATGGTPTTAGNFHINLLVSPVVDTADAANSPADDIDGDSRPNGSADDMGSDEYVQPAPAVPTLDWTGETNYTTDGVDPNSAAGGSNFIFRVKYTDVNNNAPSTRQVWIDRNDDGDYLDTNEKEDLNEVDGGDTNFTDGKLYTRTLAIAKYGDGILNYRFYAADATGDAIGDPTSNSTLTTTNNSPSLAWTGEANYTTDGVDPNSGASGANYIFRVDYTDSDNDAPTSIQVWVDRNDDGDYLDANEKEDMTEVDGGDANYTDGKRYTKTLTLVSAGNNILNYRFYAYDGTAAATGAPVSDNTVTVGSSNNAPALAWTGESNYTTDGVHPNSGPGGSNFTFKIKYSDADNNAPTSIQVWVDTNDNGTYDEEEKYVMTETDAGDTTYTDGKLYAETLLISFTGDGVMNYVFYATDGIDSATGSPTSNSTLTVTSSLLVPGVYANISAAITAASSGDAIVVSDGTYSENINYGGKNITIQSVNGAASTTIQGSGSNAAVVTFSTSENANAVLDGFTLDNLASNTMTRGILISDATPTVKNSIIKGNAAGNTGADSSTNCYGGGGVCIYNSIPTFDNVTIKANSATNRHGCGMYIQGAGGGATITNSTIGGTVSGDGNNCSNGLGGAIYFTGSTTGTLSISGSNIQYNSGYTNGGGLYLTGITNTTTITNTTILNNSSGNGNGGAIYSSSSPVSITGSSINYNSCSASKYGGAIYMTGASATLTIESNSTLNNNTNSAGGGAIYMTASGALSISDSTVSSNSTGASGGGIYLVNITNTSTVTNTTISSNTTGVNGDGAGIYASQAPLTITGGSITSNSGGTNRGGGGVWIGSGTASNNSITGTTINSNTTGGMGGGGIYIQGATTTLTLSKVKLQGNAATAGGGGGIRIASGTANITNTLITGNRIAGDWNYGGGIKNVGILNLYFSTVADNYAHYGGGLDCGGTENIYNSIIYGNEVTGGNTEIRGTTDTLYLTETASGVNFVLESGATSSTSTTDGDYHLQSTSNCIDTGDATNAPSDDIEGNSRPTDIGGKGDGSDDYDRGAYEYVP